MLLLKSAIIICLSGLMLFLYSNTASGQIRLPAIDPSGNRIFLPNANTTLLTPNSAAQNALTNPLRQGTGTVGSGVFSQRGLNPFGNVSTPRNIGRSGPAFTQPRRAPACGSSGCLEDQKQSKKHFVPNMDERKTAGQQGEILMTPSRIIAPVGSEVVVITGICGGDGYLATNQPLEWMLSNDSVGQLIEVGGMHHSTFNKLVSPEAKSSTASTLGVEQDLNELFLRAAPRRRVMTSNWPKVKLSSASRRRHREPPMSRALRLRPRAGIDAVLRLSFNGSMHCGPHQHPRKPPRERSIL